MEQLKYQVGRRFEKYLSQFVYGGIDGAVTTFAVVAGATGAQLSTGIVIILGFANLIADGFSMGVGSYLSSKSEVELARKNKKQVIEATPPVFNGLMTFISFQIVGFVPLFIYTFDYIFKLGINNPFVFASILTALSFVAIGYLKSRVAHTSKRRAVFETLLLGVVAAVIAFFVGNILEKIVTS